jgi:hypothetical protein
VGHKAAVSPEPGKCALDNPAPSEDFEPALFVRALDDLQSNPLSRQIGGEFVTAVAAIGEDVADEGKQAAGLFDEVHGAVAILNAGWENLDAKQQSYRIDKRVPFDALDLFSRIVANGIPAAAPFSVAFTAWVSMIAAVGDASRPSASRQAISSA